MPDESTHHLLFYGYVSDMVQRRGPHRERHLANIRAEQDAGRIVLAGAYGDPVAGGAMVWKGATRDEIEAFVQADPYLAAGLIEHHRIEPYAVV